MGKASLWSVVDATAVQETDHFLMLAGAANRRITVAESRKVTGLWWSTTVNAALMVGATNEIKIQAAIDRAVSIGAMIVFVPSSMLPYNAAAITFSNSARMVREGGDFSTYDVRAYGAYGDGVTDDRPAVAAAATAAAANTNAMNFPPGSYSLATALAISPFPTFAPGAEIVGAGAPTMTSAKLTDVYDWWFGNDIAKAAAAVATNRARVHVTQPTLSAKHTITTDCNLVFDTDVVCSVNANWQFECNGTTGSTYTFSSVNEAGTRTVAVTDATGIVAGDYLQVVVTISTITTYSHYIVESVSGNNVTLNRGLDTVNTTGAGEIQKYTPISVNIDGAGHLMTMSADQPEFVLFHRCFRSSIKNMFFNCTGNASTSDASVQSLIRATFCQDIGVRDNQMSGLQGGTEFSYLGIYYSSLAIVRGNTVSGGNGPLRGLECHYSTHVLFDGNIIHGLGTPVGGILGFSSYFVDVTGNNIKDMYAASDSAGVQCTNCSHMKVVGNSIHNVAGTGHIYINSAGTVEISGNILTQTLSGSSASFVVIRTGINVTVTGNVCVGKASGIRFRQVTTFSCVGNTLAGDFPAFGIGVTWVAGDLGICTDGLIADNNINFDGATASVSGILLSNNGHLRINIKNNYVRVKTSSGSGAIIGIDVELNDATTVVTGNIVNYVSGGASAYGIYVNASAARVFGNHMMTAGVTINGSCPNTDTNNDLGNEVPIAPTLLNSWVAHTGGPAPGYWRDRHGVVNLRGLVKDGTVTAGTVIFTLPVGYRPLKDEYFGVPNSGSVNIITVSANGNVVINTGGNTYLSLAGVHVRMDQ